MRFFISGCSPDQDSAMMTSSAVIMPRSPWLASAAWTKNAGVPVEAKVAAILRPIWPDLPSPVTISRPLAFRIRSAAATNGARRSDCNAADSAAIPPPSASSVRRADWTAASAGSVPDDFAISGFGLAMSVPGKRGVAPGPFHSMAGPAMRRARRHSQRVINHNCFNSVNDAFRGRSADVYQAIVFVGVFSVVMAGPATGRNSRARVFRVALPCLALMALSGTGADAQTVTPDLFSTQRASQMTSPDTPLRRTAAEANDPLNSPKLQERDKLAPSRIGQIPKYGLPAASGAADSGYDSLNRKRKKPKYYPGQAKPKPPVGPGGPPPPIASNTRLRLSIPPSESAHKTPIAPAMAGTVAGQPPRKRLKVDDDPFGAVGDYAGSFLIKSAVEFSGGHDTNPGRLAAAQAKPFYVIAPEFVAFSDWERHALVADLRGSFTGYTSNLTPNPDGTPLSAPLDIDRPSFIGHVDGRLDVSRDTKLG